MALGCKAGPVVATEGVTLDVGEGDHIDLQHSHLPQHRTRRAVSYEDWGTDV